MATATSSAVASAVGAAPCRQHVLLLLLRLLLYYYYYHYYYYYYYCYYYYYYHYHYYYYYYYSYYYYTADDVVLITTPVEQCVGMLPTGAKRSAEEPVGKVEAGRADQSWDSWFAGCVCSFINLFLLRFGFKIRRDFGLMIHNILGSGPKLRTKGFEAKTFFKKR